jgi:hypothetical protein
MTTGQASLFGEVHPEGVTDPRELDPFDCVNHVKTGRLCHRCEPKARRTDPVTSHIAALTVSNQSPTQERILKILTNVGAMTDDKIAFYFADCVANLSWDPVSPSGLRSRRAELVDQGLVRDSGRRERTASGRLSIVWEVA